MVNRAIRSYANTDEKNHLNALDKRLLKGFYISNRTEIEGLKGFFTTYREDDAAMFEHNIDAHSIKETLSNYDEY